MKIIKKIFFILFVCLTLNLSSCGTIIKSNFVQHTGKLDYYILFLDSLGLFFLIVPGVAAISIDYMTGTLFLTEEQLENLQTNPIQQELKKVLYKNKNLSENEYLHLLKNQ